MTRRSSRPLNGHRGIEVLNSGEPNRHLLGLGAPDGDGVIDLLTVAAEKDRLGRGAHRSHGVVVRALSIGARSDFPPIPNPPPFLISTNDHVL